MSQKLEDIGIENLTLPPIIKIVFIMVAEEALARGHQILKLRDSRGISEVSAVGELHLRNRGDLGHIGVVENRIRVRRINIHDLDATLYTSAKDVKKFLDSMEADVI